VLGPTDLVARTFAHAVSPRWLALLLMHQEDKAPL